MAIDRSEVLRIAELAKLEFSASELDSFTAQFQEILEYVETLKEVSVEGVDPTSHAATAAAAGAPLREDRLRPSLPVADALANAPDPGGGCFRVPKVL